MNAKYKIRFRDILCDSGNHVSEKTYFTAMDITDRKWYTIFTLTAQLDGYSKKMKNMGQCIGISLKPTSTRSVAVLFCIASKYFNVQCEYSCIAAHRNCINCEPRHVMSNKVAF